MTAVDTYVNLRAFVDELVRCGLREVCTSPGSRSTPLVLSLVRDERLRATSHLDERCGAFFAPRPGQGERPAGRAGLHVGDRRGQLRARGDRGARGARAAARAHRRPAARAARRRRRADDRPGQALRQRRQVVRGGRRPARDARARALAARPRVPRVLDGARRPARARPPQLRPARAARGSTGRCRRTSRAAAAAPAAGRGSTRLGRPAAPPDALVDGLAAELAQRPRAVARRRAGGARPAARRRRSRRFAERAGVPLLAEPTSGARRGPAAVAHYDALLRDPAWAAAHAPELVLRVGDLPTSKPLRQWLGGLPQDTLQVAFDPENAWQDPAGAVATLTARRPAPGLRRAAGAAAAPAAARATGSSPGPGPTGRPRARSPRRSAPPGCASRGSPPSSACGCRRRRRWSSPPRCRSATSRRSCPSATARRACSPTAARTASTGTVSTAFGVAAAATGPVVLLIGDVALAHDIGGLLAAAGSACRSTIVLLDNDGGGIFDFLPVAREGGAFEQHVATPHGLDFAHAAALYGLAPRARRRPSVPRALDRALAATDADPRPHRPRGERRAAPRVWEAVRAAV